jgi:hypothetical protein
MAEGSQVSPRRTKKFSAEDVKFYLARKFNEIFAKGVSSPHPWWKNVLVYTPDSLNLLVNSWKEQEEVAKLIEKEQKSPIIGMSKLGNVREKRRKMTPVRKFVLPQLTVEGLIFYHHNFHTVYVLIIFYRGTY